MTHKHINNISDCRLKTILSKGVKELSNLFTNNNMKQYQAKIIAVMAIIAVCLTFFAPLAKQVTEGIFGTYVKTVSLFGGIESFIIVLLAVIAGIGFVIFNVVCLFSRKGKGYKGVIIFGVFFLGMQVVCIVLALQYYDYSSFFGALRSEVSRMTAHPVAIIAVVLTLSSWIMCLKLRKNKDVKSNYAI